MNSELCYDTYMRHYTVGFVFNATLDRVLLMHKLKPEWQAGKLNGLGGKIEEGEDALACIVREIQEESNLVTQKSAWKEIGILHGVDGEVIFFGLVYSGPESAAQNSEEETIAWYDVEALPANIVPNLAWLIPITLSKLKNEGMEYFNITEHH